MAEGGVVVVVVVVGGDLTLRSETDKMAPREQRTQHQGTVISTHTAVS